MTSVGAAEAGSVSAEVTRALAPTGTLRAAINYGNPVLAQAGPDGPKGVSADLARALADALGVPLAFVVYDGAGRVTDAVARHEWDVAFLAIDPVRGREIDYTAPYVIIEGTYVVPAGSTLRTIDEVDRDGIRIGVSGGSAYDLFLTRALKHASLVRSGSATTARDTLKAGQVDVLAGVRRQVEGFAAQDPALRPIAERFMAIEQAVAIPKGRDVALPFVRDLVEDAKASGRVAASLRVSGQAAATVAPPAPRP